MLARNSDVDGAVRSVRELEDRFNRHFNYPWVFLNEEPFTDEFKRYVCLVCSTSADMSRSHTLQTGPGVDLRAGIFRPHPLGYVVSALVDRRGTSNSRSQ